MVREGRRGGGLGSPRGCKSPHVQDVQGHHSFLIMVVNVNIDGVVGSRRG